MPAVGRFSSSQILNRLLVALDNRRVSSGGLTSLSPLHRAPPNRWLMAFPANRGQVTKLPQVPQQQVC